MFEPRTVVTIDNQDLTYQDPHDWHKRPIGTRPGTTCPLCACPPAGTRSNGTYHRATLESENVPYRYIVRKKSPDGWKQSGVALTDAAVLDALTALVSPADSPNAAPAPCPAGPGETTLSLMARAATLHASGQDPETVLNLKRRTVYRWKRQWPEHWEAVLHAAKAQIVQAFKAQVGTAAVLDDVDAHLKCADAAERIAAREGIELFPAPDRPTLSTFFESYVLPMRLYDARPLTVVWYRNALRLWRHITGDPPIELVTSETLAFFRNALVARRGKGGVSLASANTVAARLRAIQTVLDKAGPAARRNRDAKGLIPVSPWIRAPRTETKLPRVIKTEVFKLVYDATAGMDVPTIPGIKPPAWWKALLVIAYNTQLRHRTLFEMRMDEIDWQANCLRLPAGRLKARRPMVVHLNPAAMEALRSIRTERELIFPRGSRFRAFYKRWHKLLDLAGLPRAEHFGLHNIRKTAATILAADSPRTAQLALGHTALSTTINSYIDPTSIIGAALDAMPQPFGIPSVST